MEYHIALVEAEDHARAVQSLVAVVENLIEQGWQPTGNLVATTHHHPAVFASKPSCCVLMQPMMRWRDGEQRQFDTTIAANIVEQMPHGLLNGSVLNGSVGGK